MSDNHPTADDEARTATGLRRRTRQHLDLIVAVAGLLIALGFGIHEARKLDDADSQLAITSADLRATKEELKRANERLARMNDGQTTGWQQFDAFKGQVNTVLQEMGYGTGQLRIVYQERDTLAAQVRSLRKEKNSIGAQLQNTFHTLEDMKARNTNFQHFTYLDGKQSVAASCTPPGCLNLSDWGN